MQYELGLHHELVLLALNDATGDFQSGMLTYGVAGAILSELLLLERIVTSDDKEKMVDVKCSDRTNDELLDEVLTDIETAEKPLALGKWIVKTAQIKELQHRIANQLAEAGILKQDEKKVLWLFTKRIYPEIDGSYEDAIRARMSSQMFDEKATVDERTAVLVTFAKCVNALNPNFAAVELQQHQQRIASICDGELLAGSATKETIRAVQAAHTAAIIASTIAISTATSAGIR